MPLTKQNNILVQSAPTDADLFERTGVMRTDQYSFVDPQDRTKQLTFSLTGMATNTIRRLEPPENSNTLSAANIVPKGVWCDWTNKSFMYCTDDGLFLNSQDTSGQANAQGAFNGTATGQKLFLSFTDYHGLGFGTLQTMYYYAKVVRGANNQVFVNVQVDLAGNGQSADYALLTAKTNTSSVIGTDWTLQTIDVTGSVWQCVGGTGPAALAGKAGLSASGAGTYDSMTHILTYNPNCKLLNASILDNGQPRATILGAIQIVMNSSSANVSRTNAIKSVVINSRTYKFANYGDI